MLRETLIAVAVAFVVPGITIAQTQAEPKVDSAKPSAEQKKDAQSRHDHARDHKQGAPASTPADASKSEKKKEPLHNHARMHKQQ